MKNINKLILSNFQQWKTGNIEFKPGLNILIGDTESGKSTLFRAIYSILTGKMPEDYIRKGTKGCEVKIKFSDDTYFRRIRNKKDNIADANGLIFERVGKDIPFEYFKRLGPTSIKFGTKELSLCSYSQFESHFFITLSDYDKSKLIGTICGIDIVDKLMDFINKDIRSNNSNIKFLEEQINLQKPEKEQKESEFNKLQEKCSLLGNYYIDIQDKFKMLENLLNLSYKRVSLDKDISNINKELNLLKFKISEFDKEKANRLAKLQSFKENLNLINNSITGELNKKSLLITESIIDFNKVNLLDDLIFLKEKLNNYKNSMFEINKNLTQVNNRIESLEMEKRTLLSNYDKCPLCGGVL